MSFFIQSPHIQFLADEACFNDDPIQRQVALLNLAMMQGNIGPVDPLLDVQFFEEETLQ